MARMSHEGMGQYGGRDVVGYCGAPPNPRWPSSASLCLSFVLNYEEGAENCLLHGDGQSEGLLSEMIGCPAYVGKRHTNMESLYDYGARAGFWRVREVLDKANVGVTVFGCGMAMGRNPGVVAAMVKSGWEVSSHGYRWIDYQDVDPVTEREHVRKTIQVHEQLVGERPVGIYQGKPNVNTRGIVIEEGFLYDNDLYDDDLPHWNMNYGKPHLTIPYTLDNNDMRFNIANGYCHAEQFFLYLKDAFDTLLEEGRNGAPKMMTVGLHCR